MTQEVDGDFKPERWVFLGQSPSKPNSFRWRDEAGQVLHFGKVKGRIPGGIYTVQVHRCGAEDMSAMQDPSWTGERAEDAAAIQLTAKRVEDAHRRKAMEKNTSRMADIDEALAPLLELAAPLLTADRETLLAYVTRKVWAQPTRR